jgi:hypothetical protein
MDVLVIRINDLALEFAHQKPKHSLVGELVIIRLDSSLLIAPNHRFLRMDFGQIKSRGNSSLRPDCVM